MEENNKDINYWENAMKNLPESYRLWFSEEERLLKKHIEKDSKVLDMGCGGGRSLKFLLPTTKNLVGIDHDKNVVEHAKENFKDYPEVKIILREGKDLPFKDESFDFVLCLGTFVNLGNERFDILNEMKRVLKKEGLIFITSYSEGALQERLKLYKRENSKIKEIKENGTVLFEDSVDAISEQFSKEQLESMFEKAGLNVKEIKKVGIGYVCILSNH